MENLSLETTPAAMSLLCAWKAPHSPACAKLAPGVWNVPGMFLVPLEVSPTACDVMSLVTACMEEELVRGRERSQI